MTMTPEEHIDRAETILHDVETDGCEQFPAGRAAAAVARAHIELAKLKLQLPAEMRGGDVHIYGDLDPNLVGEAVAGMTLDEYQAKKAVGHSPGKPLRSHFQGRV